MLGNILRYLEPVFQIAEKNQQKTKQASLNKTADFKIKDLTKVPITTTVKETAAEVIIPHEFDAKDYISFLLHINAKIKHTYFITKS